jgi:cytochrome b involved in lipid metabolism
MAPQQNSPGIPDLAQEAVNNGRKEILYEGFFYDISSWIKRHPGGGIIEFYTQPGENATIAIKQFHNRSMGRVQNIMKGLPKRPAMPEGRTAWYSFEGKHLASQIL